jgi:hypothetical protein
LLRACEWRTDARGPAVRALEEACDGRVLVVEGAMGIRER